MLEKLQDLLEDESGVTTVEYALIAAAAAAVVGVAGNTFYQRVGDAFDAIVLAPGSGTPANPGTPGTN